MGDGHSTHLTIQSGLHPLVSRMTRHPFTHLTTNTLTCQFAEFKERLTHVKVFIQPHTGKKQSSAIFCSKVMALFDVEAQLI